MHIAETSYEVMRFIEHGGRCRVSEDRVFGELLLYRLRGCPEIEKKQLFDWIHQILIQLAQYHKSPKNSCYRYLNPYSVLITQKGEALLLNLDSPENEFVLRNLQKRAMREHFIKPIANRKDYRKLSVDLYDFGKTVQFMLANTKVEPSLTKNQENRFIKIIEKCLSENPKKQYEDLELVLRDLPVVKERKGNGEKRKKRTIVTVLAVLGLLAAAVFVMYGVKVFGEHRGTDFLEEEQAALEELLLQNSAEDNLAVIERGNELKQRIFCCLAVAYDREEMTEEALAAYEELCAGKLPEEEMEAVYLRRIALESDASYGDQVVQTAREARERLPDSVKVAAAYLKAFCIYGGNSEQQCKKEAEALRKQFPEIEQSEEYREIKEMYFPEDLGKKEQK